jgi:hypothetical protein
LERGGKVRTMAIPDRQKETVQPIIKKHIQAGAALTPMRCLAIVDLPVTMPIKS